MIAVQLPILSGLPLRQHNYQRGSPASLALIKTLRLLILVVSLAYCTKKNKQKKTKTKSNPWLCSIWRSASNPLHHSEDHGKSPQLPSAHTWDVCWLHTFLLIQVRKRVGGSVWKQERKCLLLLVSVKKKWSVCMFRGDASILSKREPK